MKIINVKFNFKIFVIFICVIIVLLSSIFLLRLFKDNTISMNSENYTSILKEVHDNTTVYLNKNINTTGYVFRADDFLDNQFVVARDMIVSEDDYRIVGFLCECDNIKDFEDNVWVQVNGIIKLKDYHGPMPIIEVTEIKRITTPNDTFVYPPTI